MDNRRYEVWVVVPGVLEARCVSEPVGFEAAQRIERCWQLGVAGVRVEFKQIAGLDARRKGPDGKMGKPAQKRNR